MAVLCFLVAGWLVERTLAWLGRAVLAKTLSAVSLA